MKAQDQQALLSSLEVILGKANVKTSASQTARYRQGFRSGGGEALAVVFPDTLLQQWKILQACVLADVVMIMQAANTGLTEGSTPVSEGYDRPVIILNTLRMDGIHLIGEGEQVLSLPGATLYSLEKMLAPLGRQPHSVIGSSCIGSSITGGVCNNSGGALVQRGPAYTELACYAQLDQEGNLELVNELGIDLGGTPEEILGRLDSGEFTASDVKFDNRLASDKEYVQRVREVDAETPARYNADPRRLHGASGCAGKLAVFGLRLDTYKNKAREAVFYIGTNDTQVLGGLRRHILANFKSLPEVGEYLHRDCYDLAHRYGKDTVVMIDKLGTDRLPLFFQIKGRADAILNKIPLLPKQLSDRAMQLFAKVWPEVIPARMHDFRQRYEHHLILKMSDDGIEEAEAYLAEALSGAQGGFFRCDDAEAAKAMLHRFAAAGAAVRYEAIHSNKVEGVLPLDIALPRNTEQWFEQLPAEIDDQLEAKLYYGHFMCLVFHQDYVVKKGVDMAELKAKMLKLLDQRGGEYPAEHNVGHMYQAKPELAGFYKELDPCNSFNPGIGKMSREKYYGEPPVKN